MTKQKSKETPERTLQPYATVDRAEIAKMAIRHSLNQEPHSSFIHPAAQASYNNMRDVMGDTDSANPEPAPSSEQPIEITVQYVAQPAEAVEVRAA